MPDWSSWEFWAKNIAPIAGGALGLLLLAIRTRAVVRQARTAAKRHDQQTAADRERRITESFAKAVEQLGSDKLEVRLGGIYTLERIAQESERDYWPIMETLTAFVRKRAPWPPKSSGADETAHEIALRLEIEFDPTDEIRPETDIQAALTVLGRRHKTARQRDQAAGRRLDLSKAYLRGANLSEAHLEGANLDGAHLESAHLREAHLENAILNNAHLEGADLDGAYLQGAHLIEKHLNDAHLTGAHLESAGFVKTHLCRAELDRAHLKGARLAGADLTGADLHGADLAGAKNLTQCQIDAAGGDKVTQIP